MVQKIDFLPASYHQQRRRKQKRIWRRGIFGVFLLLAVGGAFRQHQAFSRLTENRDRMIEQSARMTAQLEDAAALEQRIQQLDTKADLIAMLRLHTPPTRVLATVTNNLPPHVSLTKVSLAYEKRTEAAADTAKWAQKLNTAGPPNEAEQSAEEIDLESLNQYSEENALFASIDGIAPDDVTVSQYLAALQSCGLFDEVLLLYTDRHKYQEFPLRSFGMRLRIKVRSTKSEERKQIRNQTSRGQNSRNFN